MSIEYIDKEYLSIKEFSEFTGISMDSLRYYEKMGVLKSFKRDDNDKYRYYIPTQITTSKMIRVLIEIGVKIETIKTFSEERTPVKLLKLLSKYSVKISASLNFLQEVHSVTKTYIEQLQRGVSATEDEIHIAEMPEMQIILGNENNFKDSVSFHREFIRFCGESYEPKLNTSFPIGGYFSDMDAFLKKPSQPTRFYSLDPKGRDQIAAGQYLIGYNRGYYGKTGNLPERMMSFAKMNKLQFDGPVYNTFLFDELSVADPEQYLLQASIAVKDGRRTPSRRNNYLY